MKSECAKSISGHAWCHVANEDMACPCKGGVLRPRCANSRDKKSRDWDGKGGMQDRIYILCRVCSM